MLKILYLLTFRSNTRSFFGSSVTYLRFWRCHRVSWFRSRISFGRRHTHTREMRSFVIGDVRSSLEMHIPRTHTRISRQRYGISRGRRGGISKIRDMWQCCFLDTQYFRNCTYFRDEIFRAILWLQDLSMGKISGLNYVIRFFHIYQTQVRKFGKMVRTREE
jgi:hypothetical protein